MRGEHCADPEHVHKREKHPQPNLAGWVMTVPACRLHCVCPGIRLVDAWDRVTCPDCKAQAIGDGLRHANREKVPAL